MDIQHEAREKVAFKIIRLTKIFQKSTIISSTLIITNTNGIFN